VRDDHTLLSTESIVSPSSSAGVVDPCAACGAPLADDQRYCLECGERRAPMSSVLLGGPPSGEEPQSQAPPTAPPATHAAVAAENAGRGNAVTVIAGVGVLLLAMGVGVLIGRSSAPKQSAAPAQTISVTQPAAAAGAAATTTPTAPEAASKSGSPASKGAAKKGAAGAGGSKSGVGASESHPAPPTVLKNLAKKKGKNYEQESKNLPNVISTG
jgi:hypothetical protein